MPLEKTPARLAPWPPMSQNDPKGRIPEAYPVASDPNESFWSIARKTGVDAAELLRYNFLTTTPEEINWYLKNYVGCSKTTSDGKNYQFAGAPYQPAQNKGVIFIPRTAGSVTPPVPVPSDRVLPKLPPGLNPVDPGEFQPGPMGMYEQAINKEFPVKGGWIAGKVNLTGKIKFGPDARNKAMSTVQDGKLKDVGAEILLKDFEGFLIKGSFKWKLEDCTREVFSKGNRKNLLQKIREAFELTLLSQKFKIGKNAEVELSTGVNFSQTPISVKASFKFFVMEDIGPQMGFVDPLVVGSELSGTIGFKVGPGPLMQQAARQAAASAGRGLLAAGEAAIPIAAPVFVIAVYAGFVGWGIHYTYAKGDRLVAMGWYCEGYVTQVWGGHLSAMPPNDPEIQRVIQAGREDASRDAQANFPGGRAMEQFKMSWELAAGCEPGSTDAMFAGRKLLRECVRARARADFGL